MLTPERGSAEKAPGTRRNRLGILTRAVEEAAAGTTSHSPLVAEWRKILMIEFVEALTCDDRCCRSGLRKGKIVREPE